MDKLKSVISGGHRKSTDATEGQQQSAASAQEQRAPTGGLTGQGSHLAGTHQSGKDTTIGGANTDDYHPIYDQFTGQGTKSGEPIQTRDHAPHSSNTADVQQSAPGAAGGPLEPQSATSTTSSLRPGVQGGDMSTASIKSGVIGFPQGTSDTHAALGNKHPAEQSLDRDQVVGGGGNSTTTTGEQQESSHLARDAALGAGAAGAGGLAAHELTSKPDYNQTQTADLQPFERSLNEPTGTTDTDRSFPLAGGVTTGRPSEKTAISEREPGTKEKEAGVHDGQGREALAGAAAAAAATSAAPQSERKEVDTNPRGVETGHTHNPEALAAATTSAAPRSERKEAEANPSGLQTRNTHNPEALAAATAAASNTHSGTTYPEEHDHGGYGHTYRGDPDQTSTTGEPQSGLLFTSGPHRTDTANRLDPKLHVPGEFPSPTPVEESSAPSYLQSKGTIGATSGQHELRHTGTLDEPQTRSIDQTEQPTAEHHYGRDAAVAGGLGAASAGAYAATKHHQKEPADLGEETFPTESSPYSSTKLDPRVDSKPAGFSEQRYDPTTSEKHHGRDAALTGGGLGGGALAGREAAQDRALPAASQNQAEQIAPRSRDEPQQHHYGRDAALAGAGVGAGASGLGSREDTKPREIENKEYPGAGQTQSAQIPSQPESEKSQHHHGRDAALVGAGAATTAGLYANQRANEPDSGPASSTIGPHKSNVANVLDPRVQPDPDVQKHHYAAPTVEDPAPSTVGPHKSDIANVVDPRVLPDPQKQKAPPKSSVEEPQHHYGRDAAVVGGVGAGGYGAHEAAKTYDQHRGTQPGASMNEQRYDPSAPGAHDPTAPAAHRTEDNQKPQHHYGRDAAVAGGLGAAGAGAYAATRHEGQAQQPPVAQQQYQQQYPTQAAQQPPSTHQGLQHPDTAAHQRYDSVQDPKNQHQKRDAAALGAAGATAGAGGAYAYSQHDAEKERAAAQKAHEQQLKDQQKDFDKKQKEQEKAYHNQQKELEKQQAKEQKHHNKLVAAEDKKHQKEVEKENKQAEKDAQKEEEGKEKKHHLFGFLHRDKDKDKAKEEDSPRQSRDSPRHSKEYAGAGAATGVAGGAAAYEAAHDSDSDGKKGRNRLHKDPPKGHPAREAMEHQQHEGGKHQHMGIDGPIGDPNQISGDHQTRSGVYGAHPADEQHNTIIEPHTGLPMNVEKYGDGHGGTDGSKTLEGYHQAPQGQAGQTEQQGKGVTDWEAIRKANTPY